MANNKLYAKMVKVGVVADTHLTTGVGLPQEMLNQFRDVDIIMHAGDLVSLAVLEPLKKIGPQVYAVYGNMDSAEVKHTLPEKQVITIKDFRLALIHGWGAPFNLMQAVREKFNDRPVDCIIYGHSHSPQNILDQGILYFNPGSPTDKFFAPYNSFGVLEIGKEIAGKIIRL